MNRIIENTFAQNNKTKRGDTTKICKLLNLFVYIQNSFLSYRIRNVTLSGFFKKRFYDCYNNDIPSGFMLLRMS